MLIERRNLIIERLSDLLEPLPRVRGSSRRLARRPSAGTPALRASERERERERVSERERERARESEREGAREKGGGRESERERE